MRVKSAFANCAALLVAAVAGLTATGEVARAQDDSSIAIQLSPDFEFSRICATEPELVLERDWSRWDGSFVQGDLTLMHGAVKLYARGSATVLRDRETARRMLEYLAARPWRDRTSASYELARLLLNPAAGPVDEERAIELIRSAAADGHSGAAAYLGHLHENGFFVAQDYNEAERLWRQSAGAGNSDAALNLARLYRMGLVPEPEPGAADQFMRVALLMVYTQLSRGDCATLRTIGSIFADASFNDHDPARAAQWYEAAVRTGDHEAAILLADFYRSAIGVDYDIDRAVELLTGAAQGGNINAMLRLGKMLYLGDGVAKDKEAAVHWLEMAATHRSVDALETLAEGASGTYRDAPDPEAVVRYLERAAELPNVSASVLMDLGQAREMGIGTPVDLPLALATFEQAAKLRSVPALYEQARLLLREPSLSDGREPRTLLRQAALNGDPQSMDLLSDIYRCGIGVEIQPDIADLWRERAAAAANVESLKLLASQARQQGGSELEKRYRYLRRAATEGDREAMAALALAYESGEGTNADSGRAALWRDRALAPGEGRDEALLHLAREHLRAGDARRDAPRATALLREAAESGNASAMHELGRLLLRGDRGVTPDATGAVAMLARAAELGHVQAMLELAALSEEMLAATRRDAVEWYVTAAESESLEAMLALAEREPDGARSRQWLERAQELTICEPGQLLDLAFALGRSGESDLEAKRLIGRAAAMEPRDASSLYRLGTAFRDGAAGEVSAERAAAFFRRAAAAGKIEAMRELGRLYGGDQLGDPDYHEAGRWLAKAAVQGDDSSASDLVDLIAAQQARGEEPQSPLEHLESAALAGAAAAMREFGRVHLYGIGIPLEPDVGASWLQRAAQAGDPSAMRELSRAYATGFGVDVSLAESTRWLGAAARAGDAEAMYRYAVALEMGFGVDRDPEAAGNWFAKAAGLGFGR